MGSLLRTTCLATSRDGLHWEKPAYDVVPGTNIVQTGTRDSSTVWLDSTDPARRFKMFRSHGEDGRFGLSLHVSADGIHWNDRILRTGSCGDRTTVFFNPFHRVWVYSLRHGWGEPRRRRYWEVRDLLAGPQWSRIDEPMMWLGADRLDPPRADWKIPTQLYNLDAVAYESLMLGLFTIWRGDRRIPDHRPKPNEVCVGFSRDGFHWSPSNSDICATPDRCASASAATASTGAVPTARRSCPSAKTPRPGTGATCSRPAAVVWWWAIGCASTSAVATGRTSPAWRPYAATASPR